MSSKNKVSNNNGQERVTIMKIKPTEIVIYVVFVLTVIGLFLAINYRKDLKEQAYSKAYAACMYAKENPSDAALAYCDQWEIASQSEFLCGQLGCWMDRR